MERPHSVTARIDDETLVDLTRLAERRKVEALRAFIQPALDDIEAGRTIDHEDFMREMRARHRSRDAA